jgi:hypothetical protein
MTLQSVSVGVSKQPQLAQTTAIRRAVTRILSWGRYPKTAHQRVHKPAWNDQLPEILESRRTRLPASLWPRTQLRRLLSQRRPRTDRLPPPQPHPRFRRIHGHGALRRAASASPTLSTYFFPKDGFFPSRPAPASSPSAERSPTTSTVRTITAPEPSALTSARSDLHRSNDGLVICNSEDNPTCCAPPSAVSA